MNVNDEYNSTAARRISELGAEIEVYRQAIENAEGALDSAEKELNELLSETYQPITEG